MSVKILIAYYTKTGTTAKCAALLRAQFHNHEMTVADLAREQVCLADYDAVLLGASVRFGRIDRRMRRFLRERGEELLRCRAGYFLVCGDPEQMTDVLTVDLPQPLRERAVATEAFGGELRVEAQRGPLGKFTVWMMRRAIKNSELDGDLCDSGKGRYPEILPDNIARFADKIKRI